MELIKQFIFSVWRWFIENKDTITAFFMSGQAISFAAAIVMLIKNLRGTKDNTASTKKLDETLLITNGMGESVKTLDLNFQALKKENDGLRTALKDTEARIEQSNNEIKNKLNAIVDVQSIVYSTIRDDGVRQTVNTILNNARYSDKNFKESLESQIEELKQNYSKELENVNAKMTESMNQIKSELSAADTASKIMLERTNRESIRY